MLERSVVESLDRFRTYLFRNYSQNLQQARRELPYYLNEGNLSSRVAAPSGLVTTNSGLVTTNSGL